MSDRAGANYRPGIDGLRAVAIIAVLLFHGDVSWLRGGFLGVSLFFTLSGFLVTTLLLDEHREHGRVALATFWVRRARRLLPSALLTIGAVLLLAPSLGDAGQRAALPADAIAAVGYVANWRFLVDGTSYAAQFRGQSPLLHYWSLAIEEQFYLIWPLIVTAVLGLHRPRHSGRRWLGGLIIAGLLGSVTMTVFASSSDRVYYGTDTRVAELLVGALLAVLVAVPSRAARISRIAVPLAPVALAGFVALSVVGRVDGMWIRNGGLAAFAVMNAVLVAAAWSSGWVGRVLGVLPLRAIGRVSYTLYLVHWPVFLFIDERRTGLETPALLALRLGVTAAIAVPVYHAFECPLRYRRRLGGARAALRGAVLSTAALVGGALVMPVPETRAVGEADFVIDSGAPAAATRVRLAIAGDGAAAIEVALRADRRFEIVAVASTPGCPIVAVEAQRVAPGMPERRENCDLWEHAWADVLDADADLVLIAQGKTDLDDQLVGDRWTGLEHLDHLLQFSASLGDIVRVASNEGRLVALLPPSETSNRSAVLRKEVERVAAAGRGVVMVESADGNAVASAHESVASETRRAWPRPVGTRAPAPLRVMVVGDSTSFWVAAGLEQMRATRGELIVGWSGDTGCPMMRLDSHLDLRGEVVDTSECPHFNDDWKAAARVFDPDAVLVISSVIDAADHELPGSPGWAGFGEPEFDALWRSEAEAALVELAESGAVVLWADAPGVEMLTSEGTAKWNPRLARYNELVSEFALLHHQVGSVSLLAHLGAPGAPVDRALRPDGVHLSVAAAAEAAEGWLIDEIVAAWRVTATEAAAAGCLDVDDPRPTIVLDRCAVGADDDPQSIPNSAASRLVRSGRNR